jgi:DNA replication protein DnaC
MKGVETGMEIQSIRELCKALRMPTVGSQFAKLGEQAVKENQSHLRYLEVLLAAEVEEREHRTVQRRLKEAHLPRIKTLEDFNFSQSPKVSAPQLRDLAQGNYIEQAEPVIFLGEAGTGKTHLATALCVAACQEKRRVRFTTAAGLVNELVEAQHNNQLSRVLKKYGRYELVAIDELGYVPLANVGAELLFQVVSERSERAALILTTNLPFSEWTQVFKNARLCKALLDRVTDGAHILETGSESYRFRRTLNKRKKTIKS